MIVLLDATYPYQMSYLNYWKDAWREKFGKEIIDFNILKVGDSRQLNKIIKSARLIVMLHSCTADTNLFLESIKYSLQSRKCPLVTFIGNEYNSPTLSIERRLENLREIRPEVIASQLNEDSAKWLYEGSGEKIISIPHGMPKLTPRVKRKVDFTYLGFRYPSYIFGSERNNLIEGILDCFESRRLKIEFSYDKRLSRDKWIALLNTSKITASTEAGANRIFKTDDIWKHFNGSGISISSDSRVLHRARRLPSGIKRPLRKMVISLGLNYGSLEKKDVQVNLFGGNSFSELESRNGLCISSRHLEAVSAGCWQILYKGDYSGILKADSHYTEVKFLDRSNLEDAVDAAIEIANGEKPWQVREELYEAHSYQARVAKIIENLP